MSDQNACLNMSRDTFNKGDKVFYAECAPEEGSSYSCQPGQANACMVMSNQSGANGWCQVDLCCPSDSANKIKRAPGARMADYQCPAGYDAYPSMMAVDFTKSCGADIRPGASKC